MPYVYLIGWSRQNLWYYGVRYAKDCKPEDLWKTYKTSSIYVKETIEHHGQPDVVQIRKTFSNRKIAMAWEHKVLRRLNAPRDPKWLNKTDNIAIDFYSMKHVTIPGSTAGANKTRGKSYEEIHGPVKAAELRASRSASNASRNIKHKPRTAEQRERYRLSALKRWNKT